MNQSARGNFATILPTLTLAIAGIAAKLELRIYQSASGRFPSIPITSFAAIAGIAAEERFTAMPAMARDEFESIRTRSPKAD